MRIRLRGLATRRASTFTRNLSRGLWIGVIVAAVVLILCAIVFYVAEQGSNPEVIDIWAAFKWVTVTLLIGEPAFPTTTGIGTFIFYIVVVAGVGIIALATGAIATKLISAFMRKDLGMGEYNGSDHVMICGWSPHGHEILKELHAEEVPDPADVVIVAPLERTPTEDELTTFISGSPNDTETLKRAGVQRARSAIVLADTSNPAAGPDERDALTLLTALAVETLNPDVHTCVEVIRSENLPHFRRANVDETIVSAELTGNLLAAAATTHGISGVIADLTSHDAGSEFYAVPAPAFTVGKTFHDALGELNRRIESILVAVASGGTDYALNPSPDRVIREGDRLLLISEEDPNARLASSDGSAGAG